jgi:hypothetical protein
MTVCVAGCSGGMTPTEQAGAAQVCTNAGMDYEIAKNDMGWVLAVNCVNPKSAVKS